MMKVPSNAAHPIRVQVVTWKRVGCSPALGKVCNFSGASFTFFDWRVCIRESPVYANFRSPRVHVLKARHCTRARASYCASRVQFAHYLAVGVRYFESRTYIFMNAELSYFTQIFGVI